MEEGKALLHPACAEAAAVTGHVRIPWSIIDDHLRRIGGSAFAVLATLMRRAGKDGRCWPSISSLCETTGLGKSAVKVAIARLVELGIVEREKRYSPCGDRDSNVYVIRLGGGSDSDPRRSESDPGVGRNPALGGSESDQGTNYIEPIKDEPLGRKRPNFVKPTLVELREYIAAKAFSVDPEAFFAHYESNGWRVGRNPMKCWRSALTTWQKNRHQFTKTATVPTGSAPKPFPGIRPTRNGVAQHGK